jgi:short-subunit dehydrogenase
MNSKPNKVIVITGVSQGIGFDLASRFSRAGYQVVGGSRSKPTQPYTFDYHPLDVTQTASVASFIDYVRQHYGTLHVLINNAGIGFGGAIEDMPDEALFNTLNVNLLGVDHLIRRALPLLRSVKGKIINIGSVAGDFPIPFQTYYSASKAALETYSLALANELRPLGVRVTVVKPGDTKSNFSQHRYTYLKDASIYEKRVKRSISKMEKDEAMGLPTQTVYRAIVSFIHKKNPPLSITIGVSYQLLQLLKKILPKRLVHWLLYLMYGRP